MAGNTVDLASAETSDAESTSGRGRSTIEFPYGDLDDALAVATAIHQHAGTDCQLVQLAGFLGQSSKGGAFRVKLATARVFRLVETEKSSVRLTELGMKATNPANKEKALADAFLSVPLYEKIYEKYEGHHLPPAAALERQMGELGVAKKQTPRARQAFERSADQAGFFRHGRDRLIPPVARVAEQKERKHREQFGSGGPGGGDGDTHPLISGLFQTLPTPGAEWSNRDRAKWLQAASLAFSMIYKGDDGDIEVTHRGD